MAKASKAVDMATQAHAKLGVYVPTFLRSPLRPASQGLVSSQMLHLGDAPKGLELEIPRARCAMCDPKPVWRWIEGSSTHGCWWEGDRQTPKNPNDEPRRLTGPTFLMNQTPPPFM